MMLLSTEIERESAQLKLVKEQVRMPEVARRKQLAEGSTRWWHN